MDILYEVADDCVVGDGLKDSGAGPSTESVGVEDNSDGAGGDVVGSLSCLSSKGKHVVLVFDSLQCNTVDVVDGVSKPVEVFRVKDCFVEDEVIDDEGCLVIFFM
ncbi:hypothetical protein L6452_31143 [Arctium lappa]|uniref:Uncharacterized protein n=1 Tax=Arctium lappa TaxID=4217 RepID=A0ACB8ZKC7_ARCLA|nr:hypothetical protein L6452_31143 [Arctium lappa]